LLDYFGEGIHFKELEEGYQVTVDAMESEGLYFWLLQHECNIKIISPNSVKETLIEKATGILNMYKNP